MRWWPAALKSGDIVRVRAGGVWHYGVYVSDAEVIQFGAPPRGKPVPAGEMRVLSTDVNEFAGDEIIEKARLTPLEKLRRVPPKRTVSIARSRLGEGGYDLINNNCEHFARACVFGKAVSEQTGYVQAYTEVWLAKVPERADADGVLPEARLKYINDAKDERLRRSRICDWKLLSTLIYARTGLGMDKLAFWQSPSGKWLCDRCWFSLSHSDDYVAAAICDAPVGVDVEQPGRRSKDDWLRIKRGFMNSDEHKLLRGGSEETDIAAVWTRKESLYKRMGEGGFSPRGVSALDKDTYTFIMGDAVISVSSKNGADVRFRMGSENGAKEIKPARWTGA